MQDTILRRAEEQWKAVSYGQQDLCSWDVVGSVALDPVLKGRVSKIILVYCPFRFLVSHCFT
jgi:hypothetical protein